jgi:bis(5'-nucleosyl)-tetraphosphatase (symmetrical)
MSPVQRIFVGDVQGCADELDELIARARSEFGGEFELWLVGDLINRGPENLRVLERVRELHEQGRARSVLGNHEIGLLMKWLGLRGRSSADTIDDVLASPDARDWLDWLCELPLIETGSIAGERFAMVHAAVHPDWDLETLSARAARVQQRLRSADKAELRALLGDAAEPDPDRDALDRMTRCRSVDDRAGTWSDAPPETPDDAWHARWRRRDHDYGIVYGHWALQGLHVAPGLRGIDTGCVHHGRDHDGYLTAWLPDESAGFVDPDARFWQVAAKRTYYAARGAKSRSSV